MVRKKMFTLIFCLSMILILWSGCSRSTHDASTENMKEKQDTGESVKENNTDGKQNLPDNAVKVVIDPGHGGFDPGKVSADGVIEKNLNLEIAIKVKEELENQGIIVTLTRDTDMGLYEESAKAKKTEDMRNRCKLIEETNPICTVSIHQNSFPDSSVYGPQVFYCHASEDGMELANVLQTSLNEDLAIAKPREEKENNDYYILKRSLSTTVIVECGFLSNENEAYLLTTEEYQTKVAKSICRGLLTWINGNCYNELYEYENI